MHDTHTMNGSTEGQFFILHINLDVCSSLKGILVKTSNRTRYAPAFNGVKGPHFKTFAVREPEHLEI